MGQLDNMFTKGGTNGKMNSLKDSRGAKNDGILRVDYTKAKDSNVGYKMVIRLLPNLTRDGVLGENIVSKISHYVSIPERKDLSGVFDSPRNFDPKLECTLSKLYTTLSKSGNVVLEAKANLLGYSKKDYSYCMVIKDEQAPENVGKIFILQYGPQIKDKINLEDKGSNHDGEDENGEEVNVFDLVEGKNLEIVITEANAKGKKFPEYKNSSFMKKSSFPIFNPETKKFRQAKVDSDGNIVEADQKLITDFMMAREHDIEGLSPKVLTEADITKINAIVAYLSGNSSANAASSDDFDMEETSTKKKTNVSTVSEDDFFNN
jgi:hypothetical protein